MSNFLKNTISSFWMDDDYDFDVLTGETLKPGKDYVKMASTLRAIGNFVSIVTGKSIPVKYNSKDDSYTDGKQVVISSNVKDKDFDPTVGLALHEGSHCLLTDFNVLQQLLHETKTCLPSSLVVDIADKYFGDEGDTSTQLYDSECYISQKVKMLLNYVEDRRIDNFIYRSAPGYQGYYQAMYDKYFNAKIVDKGLQSNEKRNLDWDSYMFRIINLTNANRDINALPGLLDIWNLLDLRNIGRIPDTQEALAIAIKMFEIVESNLPKPEKQDEDDNKEGGDEDGENSGNKIPKIKKGNLNPNAKELSSSQIQSLERAIKKQIDAINGETKKTNISKSDKKKVEAMKNSGSEMKTVGDGIQKAWHTPKGKGTKCLVVKNLTKELAEAGLYNTFKIYTWKDYIRQGETINKGIRLGTMLGKKLQIRNEENTLTYNRLRKGKIDKRMIPSLGFGNEQIFNQVFIDQFNPAMVHISIDASGSMSGTKWNNSQISAIAIAKAASMVQNLDVVISYRSTESIGTTTQPAIFIAYDSRKDKITKITQLFKYIECPGITPEGLCFEAIQKEIAEGNNGIDSYFINFSDGEPYFENKDITYYGPDAFNHTKTQIDNMRDRGIKVLSYFISSNHDGQTDIKNFTKMYGKDAENVNVTKLNQLTKSLNKRFATK